MKTVEFKSSVTQSGQIALPPGIAQEIPAGASLHVVLMWDWDQSGELWRTAGRERFEAAYAPEDDIYEKLNDGPGVR